jgi:hypothetical protein
MFKPGVFTLATLTFAARDVDPGRDTADDAEPGALTICIDRLWRANGLSIISLDPARGFDRREGEAWVTTPSGYRGPLLSGNEIALINELP